MEIIVSLLHSYLSSLIFYRFYVFFFSEIGDDDVDYDQFGGDNIIRRLEGMGVTDIADVKILKQ